MDNKEAYEQKLRAQMDEWQAEIDKLKAKAVSAGADMQILLDKEIETIRKKQKEAEDRFEKMQEASEAAWEDLKTGMEETMDILGQSIESAYSRFKKSK